MTSIFSANSLAQASGASQHSLCSLLAKHPSWYSSAKKAETKWGVPVAVQFAIIEQESKFDNDAKNKTSTAFGYAQVLNRTWHAFQKAEDSDAKRTNFADATNFIGWYVHQMHQQKGIDANNAYDVYLAYHDGVGAYRHDLKHPHSRVAKLARKVAHYASVYERQLASYKAPTEFSSRLQGSLMSLGV